MIIIHDLPAVIPCNMVHKCIEILFKSKTMNILKVWFRFYYTVPWYQITLSSISASVVLFHRWGRISLHRWAFWCLNGRLQLQKLWGLLAYFITLQLQLLGSTLASLNLSSLNNAPDKTSYLRNIRFWVDREELHQIWCQTNKLLMVQIFVFCVC